MSAAVRKAMIRFYQTLAEVEGRPVKLPDYLLKRDRSSATRA